MKLPDAVQMTRVPRDGFLTGVDVLLFIDGTYWQTFHLDTRDAREAQAVNPATMIEAVMLPTIYAQPLGAS